MKGLVARLLALGMLFAGGSSILAEDRVAVGWPIFENSCSKCHGSDGNRGELVPPITSRLSGLSDAEIEKTVREGLPTRGMPANNVSGAEMPNLIEFLRSLRPRFAGFKSYKQKLNLTNGKVLDGTVVGEGFEDIQLRTDDNRIHLLRRVDDLNSERSVQKPIGKPITEILVEIGLPL